MHLSTYSMMLFTRSPPKGRSPSAATLPSWLEGDKCIDISISATSVALSLQEGDDDAMLDV